MLIRNINSGRIISFVDPNDPFTAVLFAILRKDDVAEDDLEDDFRSSLPINVEVIVFQSGVKGRHIFVISIVQFEEEDESHKLFLNNFAKAFSSRLESSFTNAKHNRDTMFKSEM